MALAQTTLLDRGWKFSLGNASSPEKDFGRGTEYFNYLTKAHSIHNQGPYKEDFDDSAWADVQIPHDWVAALGFSREASHSHGYKTVGYKYPETSVGWYRRALEIGPEKEGRHFELRFDGIFRDATVWFNGFYMGTEPSGYAVQVYDITPYINFGGENVICVRADATLEEGWFYEGAGIYRNVWLVESGPVHLAQGGVWTEWADGELRVRLEITGDARAQAEIRLLDAEGKEACLAEKRQQNTFAFRPARPQLWDVDHPYLYTLEITVGEDKTFQKVGLRTAVFTAENGFLLNGRKLVLKGVNLHQDHAGVGTALPDALIEWRIRRLQELGVNAIRCSHNPATPALLDICDRLGVLVIEENRLMGVNQEHRRLLEKMVRFGQAHPSVILWSVGNEEWGLENDVRGIKVVQQMQAYVHSLDPTRQTTAANAGGSTLIEGLQIHGYNYLIQNDIENRHKRHPEWPIYGSEETTGCGTRGVYFPEEGRMPSINRSGSYPNVIERGWQFYRDSPWAGGVFFWTGLDYRGEPNPLEYPATLSEFGILDYCGFWKDEAWYLKAAWADEPVLHVFPHWNLSGHEGETIDLWVYSNCDEVKLSVNGKNLGRKPMPADGHLSWKAVYRSGKVVAEGYRKGKRVCREVVETTGPAAALTITQDRPEYNADGRDVAVISVGVKDAKGRLVPDACLPVTVTLEGPGRLLGAGNGDPAYLGPEQSADGKTLTMPAFNGLLQLLVQPSAQGELRLKCSAEMLPAQELRILAK